MSSNFGIISIIHAVLAVFCIIELGLTAYCVSVFADGWSPSRINFMLFNSIWSLLMLIYLAITPIYMARAYHSMIAVGILIVTVIFWFAGSIALAVLVGDWCRVSFCATVRAAVAFGFFIWAGFTGLTVLEGLALMRSRGHSAHADTTKPGHV